MIDFYLQQASTYAKDIDFIITLVTIIVGAWFLAAEFLFFYFILKFRAKDGVRAQHLDGTDKRHTKHVSRAHIGVLICDIVIIFFAVKVWVAVKQDMPKADETVRVVGQQWAWTFQQPGRDGALDTADDIFTGGNLNVQVDKNYHFELQSKDVLHSFSVPVFRLKQDAIPGRTVTGWFNATKTGEFDIQCAEMCGIGHGVMGARIAIRDAAEHQKWVEAHSAAPAVAALPAPVEAVPVEATPADAAPVEAAPAEAAPAEPAPAGPHAETAPNGPEPAHSPTTTGGK